MEAVMKQPGVKPRIAKLGSYVAKAKALDPRKFPDEEFELFSVPSHAEGKPEVVLGKAVGASKQLVEDDTVLLCKINPRINRVWVVSSHTKHKKIASSEWMTFPPSPDFLPKYLGYYLQQDELRDHLALNASGVGGSLMRAKPGLIKDYPFPLSPLPQQRRIVEAIELQLGRLDAAVARLQGAKARLKRYKQAVLKAAFTGQLWTEGPDMSDEAPLPDGWRWGTLGDFVKIRNGFAFKSSDYLDEGVLLIRQSNLGGEKVTTEGAKYLPPSYLAAHKDFQVHKGDILIGMSGSIGKLCTYDLEEPALQNQRTGLLQFKDPKQKPWVWNYLPMLEQSLLKQGKGVAVLNISAKQIEASPMPIPPLEVQARIIDEVEQRVSTIAETEATLDAQLQQAVRLRQAVLKRAFEGRLG